MDYYTRQYREKDILACFLVLSQHHHEWEIQIKNVVGHLENFIYFSLFWLEWTIITYLEYIYIKILTLWISSSALVFMVNLKWILSDYQSKVQEETITTGGFYA